MDPINNPEIEEVFKNYPDHVRPKMMRLRQLILDTANETAAVKKLEETLSWSEPSYKAKCGSTIRMAWKKKQPDQYTMNFTCTTSLFDTVRKFYDNKL